MTSVPLPGDPTATFLPLRSLIVLMFLSRVTTCTASGYTLTRPLRFFTSSLAKAPFFLGALYAEDASTNPISILSLYMSIAFSTAPPVDSAVQLYPGILCVIRFAIAPPSG